MKILIVALPRTGSTSVLYNLGKVLNLKVYPEPFESKYKGEKYNYNQPHIIKTMINDLKVDPISFDKVIFLSRRNLVEQLESFIYALKSNRWQARYVLHKNYLEIDSDEYKDIKTNFIDMQNKLHNLADKLNIPITYYEDLFYSDNKQKVNLVKKWGIQLNMNEFIELLDKKYKLRQLNRIH